jgi:hypothetical protein
MKKKDSLEKQFDVFSEEVIDFFDKCPEEEAAWMAVSLCRDIINSVSNNHVEELGFVELLKDDLKSFFEFCKKQEKKQDDTDKG